MPPARSTSRWKVAVVTGSRAEFGLLTPVMRAIRAHGSLELQTVVAGSHFLAPAFTHREVEDEFECHARVEMQHDAAAARTSDQLAGRLADAAAVGRGISSFAGAFASLTPHAVVVLGDRIEAFAAASAASVAGIPVAHIHGGDRAEGIADEAMRHAITKLSHIHFAATASSALRIIRMGENAAHVHLVGSPAIDGLDRVEPMSDEQARTLGDPRIVLLMHPAGLSADQEHATAVRVAEAVRRCSRALRANVLLLSPNHDAGRETLLKAFTMFANSESWRSADHLPRASFLSLLKRLSVTQNDTRGMMIGNSSAGLIEAAALRLPVVNVGPRQAGRERGANVLNCPDPATCDLDAVLSRAASLREHDIPAAHPYGKGEACRRMAELLADTDLTDPVLLRKRNSY